MKKTKCIIALIDDALNMKFLHNTVVRDWYEVTEEGTCRQRPEAKGYTHGTLCARVLEEYGRGYELIALRIMEDNKTPCSVLKLQKALELCCDLQVDIISMSVGTAVLSDTKRLEPVIQRLHEKGIWMVAAQDNRDYLTLPASYPQVLGVRCDRTGQLKAGTFCYHPDDSLGIQITANYHFETREHLPLTAPSNSLAVPMMTARISTYMQDNCRTPEEIFERLRKESLSVKLKEPLDITECTVPCIRLRGNWHSELKYRLMDQMNQNGYEAVLLTEKEMDGDGRILNLTKYDLNTALMLAERHTTADCIFIDREDDTDYPVDLEVCINAEEIRLLWEGGEEILSTLETDVDTSMTAQMIIETLS